MVDLGPFALWSVVSATATVGVYSPGSCGRWSWGRYDEAQQFALWQCDLTGVLIILCWSFFAKWLVLGGIILHSGGGFVLYFLIIMDLL